MLKGSRSSRRVDVAKVKKELMGSQIWSVVVTWAMMASMASMVASMASMASMVASMVASMASMASMASTELMVVSMALMDAPMASLASVAPKDVDGPGFDVSLLVSRIWVTDLSRRKLSNEMLRFSPMETWLGSSTKQTWIDGRCRSYETGWRCQNEEGVDGFTDLVCGNDPK